MKKGVLLLFFLITLTGYSQNTAALQTAVKKLYQANYLMDFEQIVALSYPKMVETIGKETMLEKIEKQYENEEFRLRYQLETVPFQVGAVKKINGKSFCAIKCRNPLRYFFENKLSEAQAAEKGLWLQQANHTKEVAFEPKRNSFNVRRISTFVAVMDETTYLEWKFFNLDDPGQLASLQSLFGENLLTELGL